MSGTPSARAHRELIPCSLPNSFELLLTRLVLLSASNEQVSVLGLATFDVHELVKFQYAPLAATPAFTALVEDGRTRVMYTLLSLPVASLVGLSTSSPPASHALLQRNTWVIILRLWRRRWRS
jgi:hypothetical protein